MALRGKRVLIVEDEYLISVSLANEVAASGGKVVEMVKSVDAALDIIAIAEIDCAIVDVNLMGERTFRVADALAARHIPFVFATAMSRRDAPARHADAPWLEKPLASGAVCDALASAMCHAKDGDR